MPVVQGTVQDDTLRGTNANDTIIGEDGDDYIFARGEESVVDAGAGDDTIGAIGDGTYTGGDGADLYLLSSSAKVAHTYLTITDFEPGVDKFDLLAISATFEDVAISEDADGNAVIHIDPFYGFDNFVVLQGVSPDEITEDDFIAYETVNIVNAFIGSVTSIAQGTNGHDYIAVYDDVDGGGVRLFGEAGGDYFRIQGSNYQIDGGPGDDHIILHAGVTSNVDVLGGIGDDTLSLYGSSIQVDAGPGDDYINASYATEDTRFIIGPESGNDTLEGFDLDTDILDVSRIGTSIADFTITGTAFSTLISFSDGSSLLLLFVSQDSIQAGLFDFSKDVVEGSAGNDSLIGGFFGDTIESGLGDDTLEGLEGDDMLSGDGGEDKLLGGRGDDLLYGDEGDDTLNGGDDDDTLDGGAGSDTLNGDIGQDVLLGGGDPDRLDGGIGNDTLDGGARNDTLLGGIGGDRLRGGTHNDKLSGDAGNDVLFGDHGADTLDGGVGTDTAQYLNSGVGVVVDLSTGLGSAGQAAGDVLTGIENIRGSRASDHLIGDDGANRFIGYGGWDTLEGGEGNDRLEGWRGKDVLLGGEGNDTLLGGAGDDLLSGGAGADLFVFAAGSGEDEISDFNVAVDQLDLSGISNGFTDLAGLQAASSETADGLLIEIPGGDSILLVGLNLVDLEHINVVF